MGRTLDYSTSPGCVQIFKLLHPRDLLSLARTSKAISGFVLHPKQEYIWKHSRKQTEGMPQCPSFLSERAFAHFLFAAFCHVGVLYASLLTITEL